MQPVHPRTVQHRPSTPVRQIGTWILLCLPVAVLTGSASALFLDALDAVTRLRFQWPWLLFFLPVAGAGMAVAYARWGRRSHLGNKLLIEEIHAPGGGVPTRMAPFVLIATLLTHLFGGSAGREGTAVQMGGSIAAACARRFKAAPATLRVLLMAGVAAGFGSVFGTPWAGAVFAIEVLALGRIEYAALLPIAVSAFVADRVCLAWGIHHVAYHIAALGEFGLIHELRLAGEAAGAGLIFGLASRLFVGLDHEVKTAAQRFIPAGWAQPVVGALIVIALTFVVGTGDYLGLGVLAEHPGAVTLPSAFQAGGAGTWSWLWKLVFTVVTLGSGFKGGEVTPLFYIGATLGNALGMFSGAPVDLMAGLGLVAVFAAAANTPLACTIMGMELFGPQFGIEFAIACFAAYLVSSKKGLYHVERTPAAKPLS